MLIFINILVFINTFVNKKTIIWKYHPSTVYRDDIFAPFPLFYALFGIPIKEKYLWLFFLLRYFFFLFLIDENTNTYGTYFCKWNCKPNTMDAE